MNRIALVIAAGAALAAPPSASAVGGPRRRRPRLRRSGGGHLKVAFCADDVVRVAFARDASFFDRPSLAAGVRRCEAVRVERTDAGGQATLATPKMKVRVDLATGEVAFLDARGAPVLVEKEGGRSLVPAEVQGEKTFHVRQEWGENDGRGALRPRPAPARPAGHQGLRPRPLAAQRHRGRALPRLEPRLRHPLGQHVLHALRRPARRGRPSRPTGSSTRRGSPAA